MMAIKRRLREVKEIGEDRMACLYNRKNNKLQEAGLYLRNKVKRDYQIG